MYHFIAKFRGEIITPRHSFDEVNWRESSENVFLFRKRIHLEQWNLHQRVLSRLSLQDVARHQCILFNIHVDVFDWKEYSTDCLSWRSLYSGRFSLSHLHFAYFERARIFTKTKMPLATRSVARLFASSLRTVCIFDRHQLALLCFFFFFV